MEDDVFGIRDQLAALERSLELLKEGRALERHLIEHRHKIEPEEVKAIAQRLAEMRQELNGKEVEGDRQ